MTSPASISQYYLYWCQVFYLQIWPSIYDLDIWSTYLTYIFDLDIRPFTYKFDLTCQYFSRSLTLCLSSCIDLLASASLSLQAMSSSWSCWISSLGSVWSWLLIWGEKETLDNKSKTKCKIICKTKCETNSQNEDVIRWLLYVRHSTISRESYMKYLGNKELAGCSYS